MGELLTIPELAAQLRVSPLTVRKRVTAGEWPCHRIGVQYRFTKEDVAAIDQLTAQPATPLTLPGTTRLRPVASSSTAEKRSRIAAVKASQASGRRRKVAAG